MQPSWARGAKIFLCLTAAELQTILPPGLELKPWHVLLREDDENALMHAIAHLPDHTRRLKHETGRSVLGVQDSNSLVASADNELEVPEIEVARTFVHFSCSPDHRSAYSV